MEGFGGSFPWALGRSRFQVPCFCVENHLPCHILTHLSSFERWLQDWSIVPEHCSFDPRNGGDPKSSQSHCMLHLGSSLNHGPFWCLKVAIVYIYIYKTQKGTVIFRTINHVNPKPYSAQTLNEP